MGLKQQVGKVLGPPSFDEVDIVSRIIGRPAGIMLDVGAHHGYSADPFLARGWTVYAFEPDPANRAILERRCSAAVIDPRAVSEIDGDTVDLYTSDVSTGISTLSPFHDSHAPTATVRTVRLDTYLRESAISHVGFLKSDVEGFDLFVLRSFPWDSQHPRAVVCEYEDHKTTRLGHTMHDIAMFLQSHGYAVVVSEWNPIVAYGTSHTWRRFVRYPVDVSADSWGNLIAVAPELVSSVEGAAGPAARRMKVRRLADRLRGR